MDLQSANLSGHMDGNSRALSPCVPLHPDPRVLNLPPQECTMCSPQVSYVSVPASLHAQRPNWEQKGTEAPPCTDVAILALRCLLRSNGYRKHIGKPHPIISTPAATNARERGGATSFFGPEDRLSDMILPVATSGLLVSTCLRSPSISERLTPPPRDR